MPFFLFLFRGKVAPYNKGNETLILHLFLINNYPTSSRVCFIQSKGFLSEEVLPSST
uniref:Uncharacterized protein n=1 Tax=Lepeophtheirus salmonis TaxID=72036 RepID=A0A0K2T8S4_LEPSM